MGACSGHIQQALDNKFQSFQKTTYADRMPHEGIERFNPAERFSAWETKLMLRRCALILCFFVPVCGQVAAETIRGVIEAGIYCDATTGDDSIGPRFYKYVKKSCIGKAQCRITPLDIASMHELKSEQCTGFFVILKCKTNPSKDIEAKGTFKRMKASCP
jgi:hypothetical protein